MAIFLLLLCVPLTALIINNIYYFIVSPTSEYGWYLVTDAISTGVIVWLWVLNKKGNSRKVGIGTALFISAGVAFLYSPENPSNGLIMFVLPILLASFVIEPRASFWIYLVSLGSYTVALTLSNTLIQYDVTGMTALLVVAVLTWVTSERLENMIATNDALFADLQSAYETTLEGWSHALDLRDKETEGHTLRVTELTLRMARVMGFSQEQLLQVRRGALLHDIGKMGVPDHILHKEAALTDEEWISMRRHPQLAYDLLVPIKYLEASLDIPHYHHEKWDGTGYPDGLKGEAIPLSARIFAVVDVYDALTSDRPYRQAWSKEATLAYISDQSGKYFDPHVVEIFLQELKSV